MFTGPGVKEPCGKFTGRRLKGRERKCTDTNSMGYQLGKCLPLDFHAVLGTELRDGVQGKRGGARCAAQRKLRKGSATKSKFDPLNTWGLGKLCTWVF